jgi:hypothetical protein
VTDAVKAAGQHMQQEAAHEFPDLERHGLVLCLAFGAVVLPLVGDTVLAQGNEQAVGDGDPVGVTGCWFVSIGPSVCSCLRTRRIASFLNIGNSAAYSANHQAQIRAPTTAVAVSSPDTEPSFSSHQANDRFLWEQKFPAALARRSGIGLNSTSTRSQSRTSSRIEEKIT